MPPSTLKLASGPTWDWDGLVGQEAKWPPNHCQERPRSMVRPAGTDPCSSIARSLHGSGPGCLPPCASLAVQLTLGQCSALAPPKLCCPVLTLLAPTSTPALCPCPLTPAPPGHIAGVAQLLSGGKVWNAGPWCPAWG